MGSSEKDQSLQWTTIILFVAYIFPSPRRLLKNLPLWIITLIVLIVIIIPPTCEWPLKDPMPWALSRQGNIWVKLAESLGTDSLCLPTLNVDDPLKASLIGLPMKHHTLQFLRTYSVRNSEPPETNILGSVKADICLIFKKRQSAYPENHQVTPFSFVYKNASLWCNETSTVYTDAEDNKEKYREWRRIYKDYEKDCECE
ncbi:hypothetical protein BTVI_04174 [Pitangus sulphuratus]|nr:hypothetical protein BTVI_04174 [Pitangus sulphuratus]